jgi:hypothetical protein
MDNSSARDTRVRLHIDANLPAVIGPNADAQIIEPRTKMRFDDRALQREDVLVLLGPLMIATGEEVYYLCKFPDGNDLFLISPEDLHDLSPS